MVEDVYKRQVEEISSVKVNDLAAIVETKVAESAGDTTKPTDCLLYTSRCV